MQYLKARAHQESVSNLVYTETFHELFHDIKPSQNCLFVLRSWFQGCFYFLLHLWVQSALESFISEIHFFYQKLVFNCLLDQTMKMGLTYMSEIFVDQNSSSPIHDSWRELFKAIPVYLFLTALIESCLHDTYM